MMRERYAIMGEILGLLMFGVVLVVTIGAWGAVALLFALGLIAGSQIIKTR
jgi:uncharacterized membrane protein